MALGLDPETVLRNYKRLVYKIANRYRPSGEIEDLAQVGRVGLLRAAERFDPDRGAEFTTYAIKLIEGDILKHLNRNGFFKRQDGAKERPQLVGVADIPDSRMPTEEMDFNGIAVRVAVSRLKPRLRTVVSLIFLKGLTQEVVARHLKCSQMQVSRLQRQGLDRLRVMMEGL